MSKFDLSWNYSTLDFQTSYCQTYHLSLSHFVLPKNKSSSLQNTKTNNFQYNHLTLYPTQLLTSLVSFLKYTPFQFSILLYKGYQDSCYNLPGTWPAIKNISAHFDHSNQYNQKWVIFLVFSLCIYMWSNKFLGECGINLNYLKLRISIFISNVYPILGCF